mgnify:FL=1
MQLYGAIDLHPNNGYYGIMTKEGKRVWGKRLANQPEKVLSALARFRDDLEGIAIESTCTWYWLADLLEDNGYPVLLANPTAMEQYSGLKDGNDESDAFFIAELYRLGILPTGYIMPREMRPVRDLLRRRSLFVRQRTSHKLSLQLFLNRETETKYTWNMVKALSTEEIDELLHGNEVLSYTAMEQLSAVNELTHRIKRVEEVVVGQAEIQPAFSKLQTIPGVGKIQALTIMLETGAIDRFPRCGNYTSYCRCAKAERTSNGKKKAKNNRKNGNKYLSWAYVEAAHHCRKWCEPAQTFYRRKAKKNVALATKALSSKLTKAAYYIMRDQVDFDLKKIFG